MSLTIQRIFVITILIIMILLTFIIAAGILTYIIDGNFRDSVTSFYNKYLISNDKKLDNLEKHLLKTKLPEDTEIIEAQSVLGKLNGNGNGMDYLATVLIKSEKTLAELKGYYMLYEIEVQKQDSPEFINKLLEHKNIIYKSNLNFEEYDYYTIYISKSNYADSLFDIRGH
ncbi:hypothetical protein LJB90_02595 [Eubacteriales bacterium OttesenSCG-928-G02]|nr:hypothetical protein [Eubacteriales bacterium OttesenSCG-928-G02]